MKRKLLTQIKNEWRSNTWLAIELLIVSMVMWYIVNFLTVQAITISAPMGLDTDNCYIVELGNIKPNSPGYDPSDTSEQTAFENRRAIIDRLRRHPDVECVALTETSGIPFSMSFHGIIMEAADGKDSLFLHQLNQRAISPDYLKMMRIHGINGESPEELGEVLRRGELLMTDKLLFSVGNSEATDYRSLNETAARTDNNIFIGRKMKYISNNNDAGRHIGGITPKIKRMEYEPAIDVMMELLDENNQWQASDATILVRAKEGHQTGFRERLIKDSETQFQSGNVYLNNVVSLDTNKRAIQGNARSEVRNAIVIMAFLMASIFLGLLGTFWFRTQQRVPEIAIRKVNGATRQQVFRRLISEGMLLLTLVSPLAIAGDWLMCHYELSTPLYWWDYFSAGRFAATVATTYLLMATMIVLGIWFPAYKAMHIEPAIALKDE